MSMTFAEASQRATLAGKLEALEKKGTIRPKEQKWLDNFRENEKETIDAIVGTKAGYSGFKSEAVINLDDEIYGAYKAAGDFIKNRDLQSAKEAYARYRDLVRQKQDMFEYAAPEEYAKGRVAGAGTTMGVGLGATQGLNLLKNAGIARLAELPRVFITSGKISIEAVRMGSRGKLFEKWQSKLKTPRIAEQT